MDFRNGLLGQIARMENKFGFEKAALGGNKLAGKNVKLVKMESGLHGLLAKIGRNLVQERFATRMKKKYVGNVAVKMNIDAKTTGQKGLQQGTNM